MSATDELQAMLDEHDEYYETSGSYTFWGRPIDLTTGKPINVFHNRAQPMGEDRLLVELQLATPEQAVEATLGRGKCYLDVNDNPNALLHGWSYCSECGPVYPPANELILDAIKFCPFCGRKVER